MIEFLNTLDPVLLSYYLLIAVLALLGTVAIACLQAESSFQHGFNCGRADLDLLIVKAESSGYRKGYSEGKQAGECIGKSRVQTSGPNTTKTPVKQLAKPRNNSPHSLDKISVNQPLRSQLRKLLRVSDGKASSPTL